MLINLYLDSDFIRGLREAEIREIEGVKISTSPRTAFPVPVYPQV